MGMPQRYDAAATERRHQERWARERIYEFSFDDQRPIFAIDTPPPTVSGELHIGHVYSYVQAEAMARFWRMQGFNVFYPFGFDDNGLPTERYVERRAGARAHQIGRDAFIAQCLEVSREVEDRFEAFWKGLGMSVDWRMRYSTIDPAARRAAQWSFIDLHRKGLVYRAQAPNPWCVECQTAIAQAEVDDAERTTTFYTLAFDLDERPTTNDQHGDGADQTGIPSDELRSSFVVRRSSIPIATTRPELLPACVAVFVHPDDRRYAHLIGGTAITPLFGRPVPILADRAVDPEKGTGAVMCCTFGDTADVAWWQAHKLPLVPLLSRQGRLAEAGGPYAGLTLRQAREHIVADLSAADALLGQRQADQTVRVHERCGTPLEILETSQWFIRVLDAKAALLEAGRKIAWRPAHMRARYEHWVENLSWDWCISRQRVFGVPFPAWHCDACGATVLADEEQLPLDPASARPPRPCACGSTTLRPDADVMDTWATSSVSPQIAGRMLDDQALYARLFPMQLRPQAHDIIRTWAFYTIAKSHLHFGQIPWETLMISGHALDPAGRKLSKSKGNASVAPDQLIARHGADAVRYWACGGSVGADQPTNEEAMKQGGRLITKLWNAARFISGHLEGSLTEDERPKTNDERSTLGAQDSARAQEWPSSFVLRPSFLLPIDRAMLSWLQRLIERASASFAAYEYAAAKEATERFFWNTLCDNYLEFVKARLYDGDEREQAAAQHTLAATLLALLKLLAPIMPHITEEIYGHLFAGQERQQSIHLSAWPTADLALLDEAAERVGQALLAIASYVRRFKSAERLGLGAELAGLTIVANDQQLAQALAESTIDLRSITRARVVTFAAEPGAGFEPAADGLLVRIER